MSCLGLHYGDFRKQKSKVRKSISCVLIHVLVCAPHKLQNMSIKSFLISEMLMIVIANEFVIGGFSRIWIQKIQKVFKER